MNKILQSLLLLSFALVGGSSTELQRLRRQVADLEQRLRRAEGQLISSTKPTPSATLGTLMHVHKATWATADPELAAQFAVENLGASGYQPNHHTCGATSTVAFPVTEEAGQQGAEFAFHFVLNPHKPPGAVAENATALGLYVEQLRARSFRNNSMDQFMDNHIGLVVPSLDPYVDRWRNNSVPFVCRTWCCAEGMPQFPDRCPTYSFNRTAGCEVGCYVEMPHGIVVELQCGFAGYAESLACLTRVQPDVFDLCSDKY